MIFEYFSWFVVVFFSNWKDFCDLNSEYCSFYLSSCMIKAIELIPTNKLFMVLIIIVQLITLVGFHMCNFQHICLLTPL